MHIVQADYQALIQQKLAFIPVDYLAHLYQIVSLMALPFEPVAEPISEPIVTKEELEQYASYFKQAIKTVLPTYTNVTINYQIIDNELVFIEVIPTEEAVSEKLTAISLDVDLLFLKMELLKNNYCKISQIKQCYFLVRMVLYYANKTCLPNFMLHKVANSNSL